MESGEALMFDEACLVAVEVNNKLNEEKNKMNEKKAKKEEAFQNEMSRLFEVEDGEI
ncbi:MAG: hypothetical protein ACTTJ3_02950 [Treponema sp.]